MSTDKQKNLLSKSLLSFDEVLSLILDEICTQDFQTICNFVGSETIYLCQYIETGKFVTGEDSELYDIDELKAFLTEELKGADGQCLLDINQEWTSLRLEYKGDSLFERTTGGVVVKWGDCWLAPSDFFGSPDAHTFNINSAEFFATEELAQDRIEKLRMFRKCENVEILPA